MKKKWCYSLLLIFAVFLAWRLLRPLNIFVIDQRFERPIHAEIPAGFKSAGAEECGGCHKEIYREWSESMHAKAWTEPYFQVDFAFDESKQVCLNCHIPLENQQKNLVIGFRDKDKFDPVLKTNPDYDPQLQDEGVTCIVCHLRGGKIIGPYKLDNAPHPVMADAGMSNTMGTCSRCHIVSGKRWDTFYRVPPCGTVAEIKESGQKLDCLECHMPKVTRPLVEGGEPREGRRHLFQGGHYPGMVEKALRVDIQKRFDKDKSTYDFEFTLTNVGAAHYLPTGTPDRHLTLELRLYNNQGKLIKEQVYTMKRYILWRPFIVDIKDTRLPYGKPQKYFFNIKADTENPPDHLDVTVQYHLLDEKRRKRIGYENKEPIAYPIYKQRILMSKVS